MTVDEAIEEIRRVGTIRAENGKLKLRFPEPERVRLELAIEALRQNRQAALEAISGAVAIPSSERWPESLKELADEREAASGDAVDARQEVTISWYEWKARELNRLFLEHGLTGEPGHISAKTVVDGLRHRFRGEASEWASEKRLKTPWITPNVIEPASRERSARKESILLPTPTTPPHGAKLAAEEARSESVIKRE